jgi:probable DNA metabolism protein
MKIFTIEKNLDGILSALYFSFTEKIMPDLIEEIETYQPRFDGVIINIPTNISVCERVKNALFKYAGDDIVYHLKICLMCKEHTALIHAFNYAHLILKYRKNVADMFGEKAVSDFSYTVQKVLHERHIFTGLLRFRESLQGVLYARFSPDNDIVELLSPHFLKRLGKLPFIIHDVSRNKLVISNGVRLKTVRTELPANFTPAEKENAVSNLWRKYFNSVNVKERINSKQQDGYFPRRYRKYCYETWE